MTQETPTVHGPPVRVEAEPDGPLSRGPVSVKWWLPAVPHHIVLGFLTGAPGADEGEREGRWFAHIGSTTAPALFAIVAHAFTRTSPRGLFDLVVGANRWVLRVAAHAAPMTDAHPPFRLERGGAERGVVE